MLKILVLFMELREDLGYLLRNQASMDIMFRYKPHGTCGYELIFRLCFPSKSLNIVELDIFVSPRMLCSSLVMWLCVCCSQIMLLDLAGSISLDAGLSAFMAPTTQESRPARDSMGRSQLGCVLLSEIVAFIASHTASKNSHDAALTVIENLLSHGQMIVNTVLLPHIPSLLKALKDYIVAVSEGKVAKDYFGNVVRISWCRDLINSTCSMPARLSAPQHWFQRVSRQFCATQTKFRMEAGRELMILEQCASLGVDVGSAKIVTYALFPLLANIKTIRITGPQATMMIQALTCLTAVWTSVGQLLNSVFSQEETSR